MDFDWARISIRIWILTGQKIRIILRITITIGIRGGLTTTDSIRVRLRIRISVRIRARIRIGVGIRVQIRVGKISAPSATEVTLAQVMITWHRLCTLV